MITTVIPTYRRPLLLERAIRSVLRQTVQNFQVVVYDNASGDETAAVVAAMAAEDKRVHYHVHDHDIGGPANFFYALTETTTEMVSVLPDDDVLLPYFFEQALASFVAHPTAGFVASPVFMVNEDGRILRVIGHDWSPGLYPAPTAMLRMAARDHFIVTGTLFRREAIELLPPDRDAGLSSDVNLMLRVAGRYPIVVAPRPGAVFSVHSESSSSFPRLRSYWPTWGVIIANVAADEHVPSGARKAAQRGLERRLGAGLFAVALFSLCRRDDQEAKEAADILQTRCHAFVRAFLLRLVTQVCRHIPLTRRCLNAAINWWRWRQRGDGRTEQADLDRHAAVLAVPSARMRKAA